MSHNRINMYTCNNCQQQIITKDVDDGVTPFMIGCIYCEDGRMQSSFYDVDQNLKHTHEWYRPDDPSLLSEGAMDHVERGGLLLRKIDGKDIEI